jgi:hypothetical protein
MQRTTKSAEVWGRIREKISRGALIKEAAEEYGVSVASITMRASREGWQIQQMRDRQKGKHLALGEEVAREIELELDGLGARLRGANLRSKLEIAGLTERLLKELKEAGAEMGLMTRSRCLAHVASVCEKLYRWREEPLPEDPKIVPAINLRLIRTTPEQLRQAMLAKKAREARAVHGRVVEEAPSDRREDGKRESEAKQRERELFTVTRSEASETVDPDDETGSERKVPGWEAERAKTQERDARTLASQVRRSAQAAAGFVESGRLDRGSRTGTGSIPASATESDVESPIALARKQQREESRANYERGRR